MQRSSPRLLQKKPYKEKRLSSIKPKKATDRGEGVPGSGTIAVVSDEERGDEDMATRNLTEIESHMAIGNHSETENHSEIENCSETRPTASPEARRTRNRSEIENRFETRPTARSTTSPEERRASPEERRIENHSETENLSDKRNHSSPKNISKIRRRKFNKELSRRFYL